MLCFDCLANNEVLQGTTPFLLVAQNFWLVLIKILKGFFKILNTLCACNMSKQLYGTDTSYTLEG